MLLPSQRYTYQDHRHWETLEARDRKAAAFEDLARLTTQALGIITYAYNKGPVYAGTSWGKDSVVIAHLVARTGLPIPIGRAVSTRDDRIESPEVPQVRDVFLAAHPDAEYWEHESDSEDILADMGKVAPGKYISGVRAQESAIRALAVSRYGHASKNSVRPIARWTSDHIFAYLHKHNLPVHPAYACTYGGVLDRGRIRVHNIGGTEQGSGVGRLEWERHYYPEVWAELDRRAATHT